MTLDLVKLKTLQKSFTNLILSPKAPPILHQFEPKIKPEMVWNAMKAGLAGIDIGFKDSASGSSTSNLALRIHLRETSRKEELAAIEEFQSSHPGLDFAVVKGSLLNVSLNHGFRASSAEESDSLLEHSLGWLLAEFASQSGNPLDFPKDVEMKRMSPSLQSAITARPGTSISHKNTGSGTMGSVVYKPGDDHPYLLSCWHVLAHENAQVQDRLLIPGKSDGGDAEYDHFADLAEPLLMPNQLGDVAIAKFRAWANLDSNHSWQPKTGKKKYFPITKTHRVKVEDMGREVFVSSRTQGDKMAVIDGVGTYFINYKGSLGMIAIDGFRLVPKASEKGVELSVPGDSGAFRFIEIDGEKKGIGIHFAGEPVNGTKREYALASHLEDALAKLGVGLLPSEKKPALGPTFSAGIPDFAGSDLAVSSSLNGQLCAKCGQGHP